MINSPVDKRELAAERLRARRRRLSALRNRTIATALAVFALVWGVIFVQLVSGHDPSLAATQTSASTTASTPAATTASSPAATTASSGAPSSVSTHQS